MANITKRANGTYLIRVSCGLDENGKPIQRSKTFHPSSLSLSESKKQKELEQFIFEFESEVKANADIIKACPKEYTFAAFCTEYKKIKASILYSLSISVSSDTLSIGLNSIICSPMSLT